MPEVPALDHVRRPEIDVRGVLSAMEDLGKANLRRPIDDEPFVEAAGVKGKVLGGALMQSGDLLSALAAKRLEAHEDLQVQRFHADMRRENERRTAYQAATPDASKWEADAQRGAQTVAKTYENVPGIRQGVQQALLAMGKRFKSTTGIQVGAAVKKQRFADTARAYAENIGASKEFGDYDEADRLAVEGGKLHYFSQEQVQGMLAETVARKRDDQLMTVVQEHPREAPEWFAQEDKLTEYKLNPWERQEWEHRAQSFWEDHERQSVGAILDGMANGQIREVKQLEGWKQDVGPKAYADLSEMLAARRPAGVTKNDPAMKERTLATIANARVRPEEVDSQIAMAKLGEKIKNLFTGGNRGELLGRLKATIEGLDTEKNKILGPALQWLHERVFGHPVSDMMPKAAPVDAGPETAPLLPHQATPPSSMIERVRSIRENLETAIKTGKLRTAEDATDYVAKELTASGWSPTIAASGPFQTVAQSMKGASDASAETGTDVPHITLTFSDGFRKTMKMPNRSRAAVEAQAEQIRAMAQSTPEEEASFNEAARQRMLELRLRKDPEASLDDVPEMKPTAKVVHVSTSQDDDHIEGIPVDFAWYPSEEKLRTTIRLGDYPKIDENDEEGKKWRESFKETYGSMAVNSAWQNRVPARLLTILAANEMAASDWGPVAAFADRAGLGKSQGPLQITAKTAVKEGVARDEREVSYGSLDEPGHNFDVGGRLLRVYLLRLAEDVAEGRHLKYSESFRTISTLNVPTSPIFDDLNQIRGGAPDKVFSLKPSDGLVAALGAIWNNGYNIVHVKDIAKNAEGAYAHAYSAAKIAHWTDDLIPSIKQERVNDR